MNGPQRIQRCRTRGWRIPAGAVYVGRPSKWGNPYVEGRDELAADWFYDDLMAGNITEDVEFLGKLRWYAEGYPSLDEIRSELAGKDLVCWCPLDALCHADVLLELANGPATVGTPGDEP